MARPMKLEKSRVQQDPDLIWNTVIRMVTTLKLAEMNEVQKVFQLAFRYDVEVQGGGHERYFDNVYAEFNEKTSDYIAETINALKIVGAHEQSEVLSETFKDRSSGSRQPPVAEELQQSGKYSEFEEFDDRYFQSCPDVDSLLVKYLQAHLDEFIEII